MEGRQSPRPTNLGMAIEQVRTILVPQKHCWIQRIVLPLQVT